MEEGDIVELIPELARRLVPYLRSATYRLIGDSLGVGQYVTVEVFTVQVEGYEDRAGLTINMRRDWLRKANTNLVWLTKEEAGL